jgi:hypothetical protein
MIYDNACNFKAFVNGREESSPRASILKDLIYVVDNLHIQGHVGQKCLKTFHPKLFPEIAPLNTVVCEQCNFWLGKYKYMLKHMNQYRFLFFLFIMCNFYNLMKITRNNDLKTATGFYKPRPSKRTFQHSE